MSVEERRPGAVTWPEKEDWQPDSSASHCVACSKEFTLTFRRHHCRACGFVVCEKCSKFHLADPRRANKRVRACTVCYHYLLTNPPTVESLASGLAQRYAELELDDAANEFRDDTVSAAAAGAHAFSSADDSSYPDTPHHGPAAGELSP